MFLELARAAAHNTEADGRDPISSLFETFLTRPPSQEEHAALEAYWETQNLRLQKGELDAQAITGQPETTEKLAGIVLLARLIMNLDEAITKP
jgi:hypothetical protein